MPPATAASKPIDSPASSARRASSTPWWASNALLAVITGLPAAIAARTTLSAAPDAPPISSITTSTFGSATMATGSSYQAKPLTLIPRSRLRLRAETAVIVTGRPALSVSELRLDWTMRTTDAPTVPRPAMPRRSGLPMVLFRNSLSAWAFPTNGPPETP